MALVDSSSQLLFTDTNILWVVVANSGDIDHQNSKTVILKLLLNTSTLDVVLQMSASYCHSFGIRKDTKANTSWTDLLVGGTYLGSDVTKGLSFITFDETLDSVNSNQIRMTVLNNIGIDSAGSAVNLVDFSS